MVARKKLGQPCDASENIIITRPKTMPAGCPFLWSMLSFVASSAWSPDVLYLHECMSSRWSVRHGGRSGSMSQMAQTEKNSLVVPTHANTGETVRQSDRTRADIHSGPAARQYTRANLSAQIPTSSAAMLYPLAEMVVILSTLARWV
jgi:hypothetical protein